MASFGEFLAIFLDVTVKCVWLRNFGYLFCHGFSSCRGIWGHSCASLFFALTHLVCSASSCIFMFPSLSGMQLCVHDFSELRSSIFYASVFFAFGRWGLTLVTYRDVQAFVGLRCRDDFMMHVLSLFDNVSSRLASSKTKNKKASN